MTEPLASSTSLGEAHVAPLLAWRSAGTRKDSSQPTRLLNGNLSAIYADSDAIVRIWTVEGGGVLRTWTGLVLQVLPAADSDAEELAALAGGLHAELLGVEAVSVAPLTDEAAPAGAKGLGMLVGWLLAQFGTLDGLRAVVAAVRGWASRTGRTVEVSIGGDVLKVTGVDCAAAGTDHRCLAGPPCPRRLTRRPGPGWPWW